MSDRAPWATLDDVRRMIARTELKQALNGRPYLVPPQETRPPGACSKHEYAVGPDGYCEGCRPTPTTIADDRGGARAGATSGETGGTLCTCRCTCSVGVVSRHCNVHGSPYYLTCPLHFAQPQTEDMKRIFELIKPEDCPDSGPAKADVDEIVQALRDAGFQASGNPLYDRAADMLEAEHEARITAEGDLAIARGPAKDSSDALRTHLEIKETRFQPPQRETATGAPFGGEDEIRHILRQYIASDLVESRALPEIRALVKREREAERADVANNLRHALYVAYWTAAETVHAFPEDAEKRLREVADDYRMIP